LDAASRISDRDFDLIAPVLLGHQRAAVCFSVLEYVSHDFPQAIREFILLTLVRENHLCETARLLQNRVLENSTS
jgi:hypothetical protein